MITNHQQRTTAHAAGADERRKSALHLAVTGSHGLLGSELVPFMASQGNEMTRLVRGTARHGEVAWDPAGKRFEAEALEGVDAVVHLAGENIAGRRWNTAQMRRIRDSRVNGTRLLCEALADMEKRPNVLVSASAVGFYGDRGDSTLDESSPAGRGFLAEVAQAWENATQPAVEAGIRVVHLRFGMILSPRGGALGKMVTPFKLGGGGVIGSGQQFWSWISVDDAVAAVQHAILNDALSGPVNAVAPNPVTNREFTKTLGRVLSRPTVVPMPGWIARLALGEMANELLLASTRVEPGRLIETGFGFQHSGLEAALRHLLGR